MPRVVFGVDLVEHQPVVDDERTEALLSLAVVEGTPVLSNLVEERLPAVNVVTQPIIDFLGIDHPQSFIVEPDLQVVLSILEDVENLPVGALEHLGSHLEQHILIVLFSLILLHERSLIFVGLQSRQRANQANDTMELLSPHEFSVFERWVEEEDIVL